MEVGGEVAYISIPPFGCPRAHILTPTAIAGGGGEEASRPTNHDWGGGDSQIRGFASSTNLLDGDPLGPNDVRVLSLLYSLGRWGANGPS